MFRRRSDSDRTIFAAAIAGIACAMTCLIPSALVQDSQPLPARNAEIAGNWSFVTLTEKQDDRMFVSGENVTLRVGGKTMKGKVALDAMKTPKQIDFTFPEENDRVVHIHGIFQILNGELLAICVGEADGPRPTELKAAEKQNVMFFVRAKQEIPPGQYRMVE